MSGKKLNLKETEAEREERRWRKAQRAARKSGKTTSRALRPDRSASPPLVDPTSSHRSRNKSYRYNDTAAASSSTTPYTDDDIDYNAEKLARDKVRAEVEDRLFRAKLFEAMDDDQRLDSIEADLNTYVPPRWQDGNADAPPPSTTYGFNAAEEEEYAEWVRTNMWRRQHRSEYEEQERKAREKEERKAKERAQRKESERLDKEAERARRLRRVEKEKARREKSWETYRALWDALNKPVDPSPSTHASSHAPRLTFIALPWPVYPPPTSPADLTKEAIAEFLLPTGTAPAIRKQRLREALLAYHPDRFIGRHLPNVVNADKKSVEDAVGSVVRALNLLVEESGEDS